MIYNTLIKQTAKQQPTNFSLFNFQEEDEHQYFMSVSTKKKLNKIVHHIRQQHKKIHSATNPRYQIPSPATKVMFPVSTPQIDLTYSKNSKIMILPSEDIDNKKIRRKSQIITELNSLQKIKQHSVQLVASTFVNLQQKKGLDSLNFNDLNQNSGGKTQRKSRSNRILHNIIATRAKNLTNINNKINKNALSLVKEPIIKSNNLQMQKKANKKSVLQNKLIINYRRHKL